jgi:hypothetical protein
MKLVHNISFHWHKGQLEYHLNHILKWKSSSDSEYVLTSAHKENLNWARSFINNEHYEHVNKFHYVFIPEDHGHHFGTTYNVTEGLRYVRDNLRFDYIVNSEADFMFWSEDKMIQIIDKLYKLNKHMLVMDHKAIYGNDMCRNFPYGEGYTKISTLNIYSNKMIQTVFPFDYNSELIDLGWCGESGTPWEDYLAMSISKVMGLNTAKLQNDFYDKFAYNMEYDWNVKSAIEPSDNTFTLPERFCKYGILAMPNLYSNRVGVGSEREGDQWKIISDIIDYYKDKMCDGIE